MATQAPVAMRASIFLPCALGRLLTLQMGVFHHPAKDSHKNNFTFLWIDPFMLRYRSMSRRARPSIPQDKRLLVQSGKLFLRKP
jgi:hypothetical protein